MRKFYLSLENELFLSSKKKYFLFILLLQFSLKLFSQPVISSFSPTSGPVGTTITIIGNNFNNIPANNIVFFGAVKATVTAATATSLTVTAPAGATYNPITVTVNGLTAYSTQSFILTFTGGGAITSTSFTEGENFTTDLHPNGVAITDLDGDGKVDVITPNNYSTNGSPASISILRNIGSLNAISFANRIDIPTGVLTYAIAVGDLNGDGKPEIVSSSIVDKTISIFKNTSVPGSIGFASKIDYATNSNPVSIVIGDLDGDSKLDIAVANYLSNAISIYKNTGTAGTLSFAPKVDVMTGLAPDRLALGDLDGDNKPDLVVTNNLSNTISVFKNISANGSIILAPKIDFVAGNDNPYDVTMGDLDNDGKSDLIVTNNNVNYINEASTSFVIFRNTSTIGNISFAPKLSYATGNTYHATIGDLNGDGKADVAVTNFAHSISVYENKSSAGSISLKSPVNYYSSSPYGAGIADWDGDGKADLAATNFTGESVSFFRNKITEPAITSFSPSTAGSGATVTITGNNLGGVTSVTFGGVPAASFTVLSGTSIKAVVGSGASGDIVVVSPAGTASASGFMYSAPPMVSSFAPQSASVGTTVTIKGSYFTGATSVSFGGKVAASFIIVDANTISAVLGDGATGSVSVTTPYGIGSLDGFTFLPIPTFSYFSPTYAATGSTVQIVGTNFTGTTSVSFGGIPASSFTVVSPTLVTAIVGAGATGEVSLTTPYGTVTRSGFNYIPPPVILSFSPTSAATRRVVTITGTNLSNVTSVSFGGVPANLFSIVNSTTIQAYVGEGGASGSVTVTSPSGSSSLAGFTYLPPPTITSFSPASGPIGTTVTITGTNFTGTPVVEFGGTAARSVTVVSPTTIKVVTGPGRTGTIRVYTPTGDATSLESFTFQYTPPTIQSFIPLSGTKGTAVTIFGTDFFGYPSVSFGAVASSSATVNSSTRITAIVGEGASGDVVVTTLGGTATLPGFTYIQPRPTINQFLPSSGTTGSAVTIKGTYFLGASSVTFGGIPASSFIVNSNTSITAIVGAGTSGKVVVTTPGGSSTDGGTFTYGNPVISSFSPASAGKGAEVEITGSGFYNVYSVTFGGVPAASFKQNSYTSITAVVGDGGTGDITVFAQGAKAESTGFTFTSSITTITSVAPAIASNGITVTITGYNFTGATAVTFGGIPAKSFEINSASTITAVVGGGNSGAVSVTTPSGKANFEGFIYTNAPIISGFTPESASAGSQITIHGANFSNSSSDNIVYFGAVKAKVVVATTNSLVVSVPVGATYQPITVTSNGLTGSSQKYFKVTFTTTAPFNTSSFAAKIDFETGGPPSHVSISDMDDDGKVDVAVSNYKVGGSTSNLALFQNTGSPEIISFSQKKMINSNLGPWDTFHADLDGDGKLDMIVGNLADGKAVTVFQNISSAGVVAFSNGIVLDGRSLGEFYVTAGDLNGDGKPEICAIGAYTGAVNIFKNLSANGKIAFSAVVTQGAGQYPQNMTLTDIDMDGKLDVVVKAGRNLPDLGAVTILRNTSTADTISFAAPIVFWANQYTRRMAVGDLDGDGRNDVVLTNDFSYNLTTLRNTSTPGNISFADKVEYLTKPGPYGVTIADLNGNGKPDVIVTNIFNSSVSVFENTSTVGSISLAPRFEFATGSNPRAAAVGDFDSDGRPDIVTANAEGPTISFLRNQIEGVFITSFTPANGTTGTVVTITGTNFTGATAVSFGGIPASSFVVVNPTTITAVVGNGVSGAVSITTPAGIATRAEFTFVPPPPTIISFSPMSGGINTSITITGTNFTGATAVSFGGVAATSFTVNSATSITAVVRSGASGNVSVTTPGGMATQAGFTFLTQPTITSFTPTSGGTGVSVTITGTNFTAATTVNFGGAAASFTVNSSTSITAVVGTGASGNVSVTTAGGVATLAGFTFMSPPTIKSFTPEKGRSGITVTITGTNFNETTAVSFGGIPAASFIINSSTSISAVIGAGASGDITVTTPYGIAKAGGFSFEAGRGVNELVIYPNPADEFVLVKHPSTDLPAQLKVIDLTGKVVKVIIPERNASETRIDLKGLLQGIYEVVWSDGKNKASQKLMLYK